MHATAYFQRFRQSVTIALPRSKLALKGWEKASPSASREPIPWEVCCSICCHWLDQKSESSLEAAMVALLCFD
eukprot:11026244-Karenia_brevis.AAC.2